MDIASQPEIICNKHDIDLYMIKGEQDIFRICFKLVNPNYDLHQAIGFKLFSLLGELNKDVIEKIVLEPYSENDTIMKMGMILKRFGAEFGISQKYVYSETQIHKTDDQYNFFSKKIDKADHFEIPNRCIPVKKSNGNLSISFINNNEMNVVYEFSLVIEEDMPNMMRKLPGMLMKKIFIRLKSFLETIR